MPLLVIILALISAVLQSLSDVVQHKAVFDPRNTGTDPTASAQTDLSAGAIGALVKNRLWLLGFGIIVVGFLFQAGALAIGQLVTVQTILVSMLIWVLVFAVLIERVKLTRLEYLASAPVILGLLVFVLVVRPEEGAPVVNAWGWGLASLAVLFVCIGLVVLGRRLKPGPAAALMGTAGGLMNGLAGGLTAVSLNVLQTDGVFALATNWLLYAAIIALLLAVLFPIWAFQAGPVTASMPPLTVFNPAIAYVLGVWLLDEEIHESMFEIFLIVVAWILMIVGIFALSRSKVIAEEFAEEYVEGGP